MTHECIGIKDKVKDLDKAIDEIEKLVDTWYLRYYHSRLQERHDIEINNRECEIHKLKERISELEKYEPKDILDKEKIDVHLTYNKLGKRIYLDWSSNSKKRDSVFDECGRKWFIPKLKDDSYIKIRFIGKNLDEQECRDENESVYVMGLSSSSAIIGNTVMGKGKLKDVKNGFMIEKRSLMLLLADSSVWIYALHGTENIEILESSEDINTTLEIV